MANGWSIIIGFVVVALACVAGWFLAPKGETQTYDLLPKCLTFDRRWGIWKDVELWLIGWQNLAKFSDSLVRKLLHYVGNYIPGTMASTHRTASLGPEKSYCEGLMGGT
ncbi:hypothetical protein ONS95_012538 [Cadophora gregata]|uniref:uncharacterized protein n=1 Tax=Cadophora gregata TaxID=51156 RepID=UPI0026DAF475|nr:uncharacterized protein ONS95_012538 [Cadophora gregata]KAK0118235.1 hypothetical protein ONS95_012538 [Cadophora gregata]